MKKKREQKLKINQKNETHHQCCWIAAIAAICVCISICLCIWRVPLTRLLTISHCLFFCSLFFFALHRSLFGSETSQLKRRLFATLAIGLFCRHPRLLLPFSKAGKQVGLRILGLVCKAIWIIRLQPFLDFVHVFRLGPEDMRHLPVSNWHLQGCVCSCVCA